MEFVSGYLGKVVFGPFTYLVNSVYAVNRVVYRA
jgi:hypothetical protein